MMSKIFKNKSFYNLVGIFFAVFVLLFITKNVSADFWQYDPIGEDPITICGYVDGGTYKSKDGTEKTAEIICNEKVKEKYPNTQYTIPCRKVSNIENKCVLTTNTPISLQPDKPNTNNSNGTYELLAPIGDFKDIETNNIGEYFNKIFLILIGLAGALAVVMIIIGGVEWMGTDSVFAKTEAKQRITSALLGLLIALAAYAILNTINPALLGKDGLKIDQVNIELEENVITSDAQEVLATGGTGTKLCTNVESCKALCVSTNNGKNYSGIPAGVMDPSQAKSFNNIPNVTKQAGCKNCTASSNLISNLNKIKTQTDILISNKSIPNRNYGFIVVSAYRPAKDQIRVMCASIDKNPSGLGKKYAFPALSNHGVGTAVDFYFTLDGKRVENCGATRAGGAIEKILNAAGFQRLSNESWHFQTEGGNGTCKYPNCPEPTYCSL